MDRKLRRDTLSLLKQTQGEISDTPVSWAYVAGFFDAEGHIYVPPSQNSIRLTVSQKHRCVLLSIKAFLAEEGFVAGVKLYKRKAEYVLVVLTTDTCKAILQELLTAGLATKRDAADAALKLDKTNHSAIRQTLAGLVGRQSRYRHLDQEGCKRAKDIISLRKKVRTASKLNAENSLELQQQLDELKYTHLLKNSEKRLQLLRSDIRLLLKNG
eukprot:TRINITY_DN41304_c0_g1_i1.p1 TRINITY_DN41304_c0_g1~~TRINITY_DN41304_c0_g1_i1.p1  ORF type:complete len:233 (-),score=33.42 TRINITY_DN41304_c0_g1_i1:242-880(-)